ncbi:hypothetical protein CHUAL_007189 [Chamberlinius hualienensis]
MTINCVPELPVVCKDPGVTNGIAYIVAIILESVIDRDLAEILTNFTDIYACSIINDKQKTLNLSTYIPRPPNYSLNSVDNFTQSEMSEQHDISLPLASTEAMVPVDSLANVVTNKGAIQTLSELELIEIVAKERVVVIADKAGSGKSPLLY